MKTQDVGALRDRLNTLTRRANEQLGSFDADSIGIGRYVPGSSPWERHTNGDELLLVTDGEVRIEVLENDGTPRVELLREGTLFVVPKGLWHQLTASTSCTSARAKLALRGNESTRDADVVPAAKLRAFAVDAESIGRFS